MLFAMIKGALIGGVMGWVGLIIMVSMAQGKKPRTQIQVQSTTDLWPQIELWCAAHGYKLTSSEAGHRLYQRGSGVWQAAARLDVTQKENDWQIEAFLFMTSFVNTAEIALDETGLTAKLPRDNRKKEFNVLLGQLGQPALA